MQRVNFYKNMREIKFRAWDKDNKIMLGDITPSIIPLGVNDLIQGTTLIPMQFTGLKDKNGVDIYEGDIVKIPMQPKYKSIWIVIFQDGAFCLTDKIGVRCLFKNKYKLEVIGNIYESPELLK